MAKRFTDTDKYKKPFIRGLKGAYKLLWDYLYHECDNSGVWIVDFDIAQIYLGMDMPINKREALEVFNSDEVKIVEIDGGKKWFIPSFLTFQYGQLSPENRFHKSILLKLSQNGIDLNKPLTSPLQGSKDKDMDKDMDKNKDKEPEPDLIFPFDTPTFLKNWELWKQYKKEQHKFTYKHISEQAALKSISNLSNGNEEKAIQIIHQSINNGWKGFFELKNNANGHTKKERPIYTAALEVLYNASGNKPE